MSTLTTAPTVWPAHDLTNAAGRPAAAFNRATLDHAAAQLHTLAEQGGTLGDEARTILTGWDAYTATTPDNGLSELAAAVIAGDDPEDLAEWHAVALSRHTPDKGQAGRAEAAVRNAVAAQVGPALRRAYLDTTAEDNVTDAAGDFNALAADYTRAAETADPGADPADIVAQPPKVQKAWMALQSLRSQLDAACSRLELAHAAAGHDVHGPAAVATVDSLNAANLHELRAAWIVGPTRPGGRWWALIQAGAELHAHPHTGRAVLREPRPAETIQVPGTLAGSIRQPELDPEDPDQRAQLEQHHRMDAGALALPNVVTT